MTAKVTKTEEWVVRSKGKEVKRLQDNRRIELYMRPTQNIKNIGSQRSSTYGVHLTLYTHTYIIDTPERKGDIKDIKMGLGKQKVIARRMIRGRNMSWIAHIFSGLESKGRWDALSVAVEEDVHYDGGDMDYKMWLDGHV